MRLARRVAVRITLVLAAVIALGAAVPPSPVAAYGASYPTLGAGDRGTNVRVVQLLLRQRGHGVAVDGVFGSATRSALTAFQRKVGITADGLARPDTWSRLVVGVRYDSRGAAVQAVQSLLNEKHGAGLPVTGWFGPMTRSAVTAFQRHAGLTIDGVAGAATWRYLVAHFERPATGAALCVYATGANAHGAHWGTSNTITALERAARTVHAAGHGPIAVGDVSLEHGGRITGHVTHRTGLDADLRPMRTAENQCRYGATWYRWSAGKKVCCNPAYDRAATRALIKALRAAAGNRLDVIAFNDPQLIAEGLTMYLAGHDDHLHASFCEVLHPVAGYTC